jgi:hypothetical protein
MSMSGLARRHHGAGPAGHQQVVVDRRAAGCEAFLAACRPGPPATGRATLGHRLVHGGPQHHPEDLDRAAGVDAAGGHAIDPRRDMVAGQPVERDAAEARADVLGRPLVLLATLRRHADLGRRPCLDQLADRSLVGPRGRFGVAALEELDQGAAGGALRRVGRDGPLPESASTPSTRTTHFSRCPERGRRPRRSGGASGLDHTC